MSFLIKIWTLLDHPVAHYPPERWSARGVSFIPLKNEVELKLHGFWNQTAMGSNPSSDICCVALGKLFNSPGL